MNKRNKYFGIGKNGTMNKIELKLKLLMELLIPLIQFIHEDLFCETKGMNFTKKIHFCSIPKMEYMELFWNGIQCDWQIFYGMMHSKQIYSTKSFNTSTTFIRSGECYGL